VCGLLIAFALIGCSTLHPTQEYVFAREALASAKDVEAARYNPGLWHKAEEAFRHGVQLYEDNSYDEAIEQFRNSKAYAERAENFARLQKLKTGGESQ
jgi:hypothetical protein